MNIANIFGLHLGCKVRLKSFKPYGQKYGELYSVKRNSEGKEGHEVVIKYDVAKYNRMFTRGIEHCKLLLKPLSAITDEDKAEFAHLAGVRPHDKILEVINRCGGVEYLTNENLFRKVYCAVYEPPSILFLASKGYDIGLVPDEYKEVEQ